MITSGEPTFFTGGSLESAMRMILVISIKLSLLFSFFLGVFREKFGLWRSRGL